MKDRDIFYDWYNAYFQVEYQFQALANSALVAADAQLAPVNGSFSLIKSMTVNSAGKRVYEATNIHKVIFIKNLVEFSADYATTMAPQDEFWYLDNDNTNVTAAATMNKGIWARALLSRDPHKNCESVIRLNRYSFFEELPDKHFPPMQLSFNSGLQTDNELIFQHDVTGRRIVVTRMLLWVPKLLLTPEGQNMVNENFLKPKKWKKH